MSLPAPPVPAGTPALELRGIHKRFGGVVALDGVDLRVRAGTVHALLGENGAGKSTLMRVAFGMVSPDAGTVSVGESRMARPSVPMAIRAGLGMVHQHLSLAESLDTTENHALGNSGLFRRRDSTAALQQLMDESGLQVPVDALARQLTLVQQQRLEILKALGRGARILILDEPTAVLAPQESRDLMKWVRSFVTGGGSVVLVTHRLREALAAADDITVLRRGQVTFQGPSAGSSEAALARAIFPEAVSDAAVAPASMAVAAQPVVVTATDLTIADRRGAPGIRGASFALRGGEIVGVAAVEGSGHRELLAALGALRPPTSGALRLPDRVVVIPADRLRDGVVGAFTLAENVALLDVGRARGRMDWPGIGARTQGLIHRFGIAAPSADTTAEALSGGNQQRLVVARALEHPVDLIVADNPTRGLDLLATAFVHAQLRLAAADGAAVVVHSSDIDEVLALASRILVVFAGTVRELQPDRDAVGSAMLGAA